MSATSTRRALFAIVPAFAMGGAALAAQKPQPPQPDDWADLLTLVSSFDPEHGPETMAAARREGLDIRDFAGIYREHREGRRFFLIFQDASYKMVHVGPSGRLMRGGF